MELKWLEDFISLANTRSFSKSAEQRNVTQPAFSRRIRALETWLGTSLIDRSTYPTTLTETGRSFRETAEQTLLVIHEARDAIREQESQNRAAISFSALHTIALTFIPSWLKEVQDLLGTINTRINPGNFHDCVQALADGSCDFLLTFSHDSVPILLDPQIYPSIKLAEDAFMPVSGTDRRGRPLFRIGPSVAKPVPWLTYTSDSYFGRVEQFILAHQKHRPSLNPVCENPMGESLKAMVLEGHGIAWLAGSSIKEDVASKRLAVIGTNKLQMKFDVRMYRSIEKSRPQVMQFWSCVESLLEFSGLDRK